jgi:hypothetical protein
MEHTKFKVHYTGSIFWLIFWLIFFFPIAIVLFFTGYTYQKNGIHYRIHYEGSKFWLCFWTLFFFPVAFLLFFLNGFSIRAISS